MNPFGHFGATPVTFLVVLPLTHVMVFLTAETGVEVVAIEGEGLASADGVEVGVTLAATVGVGVDVGEIVGVGVGVGEGEGAGGV